MPKRVDKEERMNEIVKGAMPVFSRYGYREANLSQIADECGLSRPTVYQYFKDKNEIYYYAVKSVTKKMFSDFSFLAFNCDNKSEIEKLRLIVEYIFDFARKNEGAISNLIEFILTEKKNGKDVYSYLKERTIKLRILIKRIILLGVKNGTIRDVDSEKTGDVLYSLIQSAAIQYGFFSRSSETDSLSSIDAFLDTITKK